MNKARIEYNPAYSDFFESEARYTVLYGGAGSGKSYAAAQKLLLRCLRHGHERILILRHVARTCRDSTFRLVRDVVAAARVEALVSRSEMRIAFPNGSEILHAGLDDPEKLKSVAGVTSIWIEEATEITEADFQQVDLRLRGDVPTYRQVVMTFNPVSRRHWLKRFIESRADAAYVLRTTWRDNAFIDDEYAHVLRSLPDENYRRIYEAGEWGEDVRGLIYSAWTADGSVDDADAYGLDFGFNHPNALVAVRVDGEDLHADELLYESHLTTPDLVARLDALGVRRDRPIYCDSARPDQIEEIARAGYYAIASDKDVAAGIQAVKRYRLHVAPDAQNLQNELLSYKWQEARDGTPTDKPLKFSDHLADALRYVVNSHYSHASAWGLW